MQAGSGARWGVHDGRRVRVLGHRGVPIRAPENTLLGFDTALREGADGVELDVRLCATGELVVCHDVTLARFTGGAAVRVAGAGAWALKRWDVGDGERVPLLTEVLPRMRGHVLNVEVKARRELSELPTVLKAIKAVEEKLGSDGRVLVRFSGTEAKARVLIEGPDARRNVEWAQEIGDALKRALAL